MKVLVTAGPTREFIDPVRFISNRSSGKMGYSIAAAFCKRGHDVVLISGPLSLQPPPNISFISVVSALDMLKAVKAEFLSCDCIVMAAAVADWKPIKRYDSKVKKGGNSMSIDLEPTDDILIELAALRKKQIVAGFAAETGDPVEEARRKLSEKRLDVIFANDVSLDDGGFEVDTNRIICIEPDGPAEAWPLLSKEAAGDRIAEMIEALYVSSR